MAGRGLPGEPAKLQAVAEEGGEEEEQEEEEPQCPAPRVDQSLADEVAELRRRVKKQESRISELAVYASTVQKDSILAITKKVEQLCARSTTEPPEAERPGEEGEPPRMPPADERIAAPAGLTTDQLALVRQQVQEAMAPRAAMEGFVQGLAVEMREAFEALRSELQLQGAESQAGLSTLQVQMEGYRLQAVGCEASFADLRAELDRRRGTDEQAAQGFLSGLSHELRETQTSQMRALLDHGEKLTACGSQMQAQGLRLEEIEAAVGELSRCLVDIGTRLRGLKESDSSDGEDKSHVAAWATLGLQAVEQLLATQRSQKAGAEEAQHATSLGSTSLGSTAANQLQHATSLGSLPVGSTGRRSPIRRPSSPTDQLQQATALEAVTVGSWCVPTQRHSSPSQQPSAEASALQSGASDAAAFTAGHAVESSKTLTPVGTSRPASVAIPRAARTAEVRTLIQNFEAAAAATAAAHSRPAPQHPSVGRYRSAPQGVQKACKPQAAPQQQTVALQSMACPWPPTPQRFFAGSTAQADPASQGQLVARPAATALQQRVGSMPHPVQRSGSPVPVRGAVGGAPAPEAAAVVQQAPSPMSSVGPVGSVSRSLSVTAMLGTSRAAPAMALAPGGDASSPRPAAHGAAVLQWQHQQMSLRRLGS